MGWDFLISGFIADLILKRSERMFINSKNKKIAANYIPLLMDGIDFNGLAKFHESVVANIINIYALVGLPDKTDI